MFQQPAWGRSREFEITTRSVGRNGLTQTTTGDVEDEQDEEEDGDSLVHGRRKRKVAFMPSLGKFCDTWQLALNYTYGAPDTTHTIYYRGHWLRAS